MQSPIEGLSQFQKDWNRARSRASGTFHLHGYTPRRPLKCVDFGVQPIWVDDFAEIAGLVKTLK